MRAGISSDTAAPDDRIVTLPRRTTQIGVIRHVSTATCILERYCRRNGHSPLPRAACRIIRTPRAILRCYPVHVTPGELRATHSASATGGTQKNTSRISATSR